MHTPEVEHRSRIPPEAAAAADTRILMCTPGILVAARTEPPLHAAGKRLDQRGTRLLVHRPWIP